MSAEPAAGGRRDYDPAGDPEMKLWVTQEIAETRHALRNDITTLATQVAALQLVSSREHAEVKASLDALLADLAEVKRISERVSVLERTAAADHAAASATESLRSDLKKTALALATLIVGAAGVIVAVVH